MPISLCLRSTQLLAGGLIIWVIFTQSVTEKAHSSPIPQREFSGRINLPETPSMNYVQELADVYPTDWEFQALQSLAQRYGVKAGLPDGTFRGSRSLTRYEFAEALNRVLNQIDALIAKNLGTQINQEDLSTLQRLQTEYSSALTDLKDRLSDIGQRTENLAANQFSATTKFQGEAIVAFTSGSGANMTIVNRQRLSLLTSLTPRDGLLTQLESGNNGGDGISKAQNRRLNLLGTTGFLADGGGLDYAEVPTQVQLRRLYYTFRPHSDLAVTIGAKMLPRDFIDYNQYANNEAVDFSSSFFIRNPLIVQNQIDRTGGAGAAIKWNIGGGPLTVRAVYVAADANQPSPTTQHQGGLFHDRYQGSAEVEYRIPKLAVRLEYTNALINHTDIEAGGLNAEYAFNRTTGIFGRFGFGSYQGFNSAIMSRLDLHPYTWAVGLTLRNIAIPGTLAGVAIGQPFVTGNLGNATQTNIEAFYNLQLSDNISITPGLQVVTNPNNDHNATIWQGTLRTVLRF